MSGHFHEPVPKLPLLGMLSLVLITVVGVGWISFTQDRSVPVVIEAQMLAERSLRFEDASDGRVIVIDDTTGDQLEALDPGTNGFLRATLRGLARDRHPLSVGAEVPFHVRRYDNGRLLLVDPVTERHVDLVAFGPINAGVFARYLAAPIGGVGTVKEM
ncbi:MAG: photosynthetic complex assembly protein PuhC [Gammaproteobacteria bacterium]